MRLQTGILLGLLAMGIAPLLTAVGIQLPVTLAAFERAAEEQTHTELRGDLLALESRLQELRTSAQLLARSVGVPASGRGPDLDGQTLSPGAGGNAALRTLAEDNRNGQPLLQELRLFDLAGTTRLRWVRGAEGQFLEVPGGSNAALRYRAEAPAECCATWVHHPLPGSESGQRQLLYIAAPILDASGSLVGELNLGFDPLLLADTLPDLLWALPDGRFMHVPEDLVLAGWGAGSSGLASLFSASSTFLWEQAGVKLMWTPLGLDSRGAAVLWMGREVDETALSEWLSWSGTTVLAIAALLLAGVSLLAWWVSARAERGRRTLVQGIDRLIRRGERTEFDLGGTTDLQELGHELTALGERYLKADAARKIAEQSLREANENLERQVHERTNELTSSERRVRLLLDSVSEAIFGVDTDGFCTFCNPSSLRLLRLSEERELIGQDMSRLLRRVDRPTGSGDGEDRFMLAALGGKPVHSSEERLIRPDGSSFPVEYWSHPVRGASGELLGAVITFLDITQRRQAEEALFQEKELAQVTLESIGDGLITTDAIGRVTYLNPVAENLLNWSNGKAHGRDLFDVFKLLDELTRDPVRTLAQPVHGLPDGQPLPNPTEPKAHPAPDALMGTGGSEFGADATGPGGRRPNTPSLLQRRDGREIYVEHSASQIRNRSKDIIGEIVVFRDVTESRRMERQLEYLATHDSLTGQINRHEFERRLERLLLGRRADDARTSHAVCYVDLDQFKVVNDTCGHMAGDDLLKQLSQLLLKHMRAKDTLARLGGDEFGILLENCPLKQVMRIADAVRQTIQDFRFVRDDRVFTLGASIGVVMVDSDDPNATVPSILSAADAACYTAKEKGRNRVQLYHTADQEVQKQQGEMRWVARINRALEESRFRLFYQPIVSLDRTLHQDHADHFEILVRMVDEDGGLAPPGAFLPAAERYNLISATDRWVVRTVFEWLATRSGDDTEAITLEVNLSGPTLSDNSFLNWVLDLQEQTGVSPEFICFEITETAAIAKLGNATKLMRALKERGFRFALDDFGSGLSSFAYLKTLPVDYLKIDGSFIKDIADDPIDRAMVKSINEIGHVMGKKTIAEYVESDRIVQILRDIGVDYAQGYLVAPPRPLGELKRMLAA